MKRLLPILLVVGLLLAGGALWHHFSTGAKGGDEEGGDEAAKNAVVHVETAKLVRKDLTETATAYGLVVAQPGRARTVSVAFEAQIRRVLIAPGQAVQTGDALFEIQPSPASETTFEQAETAANNAEKDLAQTSERHRLKLATNQELGAAQKAASDAQAQLQSLKQQGLGGDRMVRAEVSGLITRVDAQDGQTLAGGASMAEVTPQDEIEVKLGIEPAAAAVLKAGQAVDLFPLNGAETNSVKGTVRLVTQTLDATTRLVMAYVTVPKEAHLLLGGYVRAEIATQASQVLTAPRSALLPVDGGFSLFTVKDGHAVAHTVRTGLENEQEIEVIAPDLAEGTEIVVTGNYELEDGLAVETPSAK
ncbi:MAG: efflux RND transporter periplasmic adaptor subunit [Chthoniobacteraceae bacterium]